jgi:phage/plasmid-like protein (TIGR03299 family)
MIFIYLARGELETSMAHEIDESTGRAAIAYVGEQPWHRLGERLPADQPIEVWLQTARLDWELRRLPVQYLVDGRLRTMDGSFVLARSDTHEALSIVSGDYHIVQPREVLEFYRDLMDEYGYTLETAGALDHGRKVWALARTGVTETAGKSNEDGIAAYVLLATSCDKTLATMAAFTSIRVVCQNTLFFATEEVRKKGRPQVKVPHNLYFDAHAVKAELGLMEPAWEVFLKRVRKMTAHPMKAPDAASFFEKLLRQKQDRPLSKAAAREHGTMVALFRSAPGQDLATAKETLWGAVNAVTYYADHVRSGVEDRLDAAWFGAGYALKEKAWSEASALVG